MIYISNVDHLINTRSDFYILHNVSNFINYDFITSRIPDTYHISLSFHDIGGIEDENLFINIDHPGKEVILYGAHIDDDDYIYMGYYSEKNNKLENVIINYIDNKAYKSLCNSLIKNGYKLNKRTLTIGDYHYIVIYSSLKEVDHYRFDHAKEISVILI